MDWEPGSIGFSLWAHPWFLNFLERSQEELLEQIYDQSIDFFELGKNLQAALLGSEDTDGKLFQFLINRANEDVFLLIENVLLAQVFFNTKAACSGKFQKLGYR